MSAKETLIQPYLFFDGCCEEALEFYKSALGAEVKMLVRFKDSPDQSHIKPGTENKVMHARFTVGSAIVMASDGHCGGQPAFEGFSLSLTVSIPADADRYFNALAAGGQIRMPLEKTFFSPRFGMVSDKFGILWMVLTE